MAQLIGRLLQPVAGAPRNHYLVHSGLALLQDFSIAPEGRRRGLDSASETMPSLTIALASFEQLLRFFVGRVGL